MSSKLESRLSEYENSTPIVSDPELISAIETIIEEELSLDPDERDYDLLEEAIASVLSLQNVDLNELSEMASTLRKRFVESKKQGEDTKKNTRSFRLKWLIPVAVIISLIATVIATCYAFGFDVISMSKKAIMSFTPGTEYSDGQHDIIRAETIREYKTFDEMIAEEQLTGLLKNDYFNDSEIVDTVRLEDYGSYLEISILTKGDYSGLFQITCPSEFASVPDPIEKVGILDVNFVSYDDVFQAEWLYKGNFYFLSVHSQDELIRILDQFKESE